MRVEPTPSVVVVKDAGPGITWQWQLNDPQSRRDPPGTMFRIGRDQRRAVVARLLGDGRTVAAARGARRLRSDVATALRCLGLGDLAVSRELLHAPVTLELEPVAIETPAPALDDAVRAAVERLDRLGPGPVPADADRYFVVQACLLAHSISVALPRAIGDALDRADEPARHGVTVTANGPDEVVLRLALDRPERLACRVAEIRRAPAGVSMVPVQDVLTWTPEPPDGALALSAAGPGFDAGGDRAPATDAAGSAPEPALLHWNTRLRDGDRVVDALVIGRVSVLETWLGPDVAAGALLDTSVPAELVPDGTTVTFAIACSRPVLRPAAGGPGVARDSATATITGGATPVVGVEVVPDHAGDLTFVLSLYTGGALRVRSQLVVPVASATEAPGAIASVGGPALAPQALTGRDAAVRLEIDDGGRLEVDVAPLHWGPAPPAQPLDELAATAVGVRRQLVELSKAYRAKPGAGPFALDQPADALLAFARLGAELHGAFFGFPDDADVDAGLRQAGKLIAGCPGGRMQIVAANLPFPWAVLYDGRYLDPDHRLETAADVDLSRFWGARFQIDRAVDAHLDGTWPPRPGDPVRAQLCLNPHLDAELSVHVIGAEQQIFDRREVVPLPAITDNAGLRAFLQQPSRPMDLLYLFCHASAAETMNAMFFRPQKAPDVQASLMLDAESSPRGALTVSELRELRRRPLDGQPLIVFNACGSAAGDRAFQSKFLTLFVGTWRARGLIGTDWVVNPVFADAFGRRLIQHLLDDRLPVANALAAVTNEALAAGNPYGFVYALYARPDFAFFPGGMP